MHRAEIAEVRGQYGGISSLLPACGFWGLNLGQWT